MPLPDFQSLILPALKALADGKEASTAAIRKRVADSEKIPPAELEELVPSGRQTKYSNRINWALVHTRRAGLVERPRRGVYRLAEEGRKVLAQRPNRVSLKVLRKYPAYIEWTKLTRPAPPTKIAPEPPPATPEEVLGRAFRELRDSVEAEILKRVLRAEPKFLERVVVDLLIAMGYGGGDTEMGQVTGSTGDGGIDGTIREDPLGLDEVYIQAKQYALNNTVGEGALRNFAGAIDAAGTTKGVFVTTASFTQPAKDYIERSPKRIVLIDGRRLAQLMVQHNIGVRTRRHLEIKRIDEDYFDSDSR